MYGLLLDVGIVTDHKVHTCLYNIENELFNGRLCRVQPLLQESVCVSYISYITFSLAHFCI